METRANYIFVGVFVIVLVTGLLVFALWLAKTQFEVEVARYDIYFTGSITGLKNGSVVSYRGISVGQVVDIEIDPENIDRVIVTIEVQARTPVRTDTVASVEIQGLAGVPYILLSGGTQAAARLVATEGQRYPVIASVPSRIEQVLAGAPMTVERINVLLSRANELLSPENREAVANTLHNLNTVSDALAARSGDYEAVVRDATATLANLRDGSAALERLAEKLEADSTRLTERADATLGTIGQAVTNVDSSVTSVRADIKPVLEEMRETAAYAKDAAKQIDDMVAENRPPLRDFSSSALVELVSLLSETRQLVGNLNRLTAEIERDPARFFFGSKQEGYETNKR
ncbi:MAG: MlaD family protein [Alphaproteobacteria bacterium]